MFRLISLLVSYSPIWSQNLWADNCSKIILKIADQTKYATPHFAKLAYSKKTRVLKAGFLNAPDSPPRLVTTQEHANLDIAIFNAISGELIMKKRSNHMTKNGWGYAAHDLQIAPDSSFFITESDITSPIVYHSVTGKMIRKLQDPKDLENDKTYFTFLSNDSRLIITVTEAGRLNAWRRISKGNDFDFQIAASLNLDLSKTEEVRVISFRDNWIVVGTDKSRLLSFSLPADSEMPVETTGIVDFKKLASESIVEIGNISFLEERSVVLVELNNYWKKDDELQILGTSLFAFNFHDGKFSQPTRKAYFEGELYDIQVIDNDRLLLLQDTGRILVWSLNDGHALWEGEIERDKKLHYLSQVDNGSDPIISTVVTPDKKFIVTGSDGGNLSIWNIYTGQIVKNIRVQCDIRSLAISKDGTQLAIGAHMGDGRIFKLADLINK